MHIDPKEWRPITFQGTVQPQSLMAITVLGAALPDLDDETDSWLWELAICCGRSKSSSAIECAQYSRRALNGILEHQSQVQEYIKTNLLEFGFDAEVTCKEWLASLNSILNLSIASPDRCFWSAPSHADDPLSSKDGVDRLIRALDASCKLLDQNEK